MTQWAIRALVVFALTLSAVACTAVAQARETISQIYMEGLHRVDRDTVLYLMHTRRGSPYDPKILQEDLQTLKHSKYFRSVKLRVDNDPNDPNAEVVTLYLVEWPVIVGVDYSGLDSVSPSDIANRFKARDVDLAVGGFFNPAALYDAQEVIRDVLARHGHPGAQVKASFELVPVPGANAVNLTFSVAEGPANSH